MVTAYVAINCYKAAQYLLTVGTSGNSRNTKRNWRLSTNI